MESYRAKLQLHADLPSTAPAPTDNKPEIPDAYSCEFVPTPDKSEIIDGTYCAHVLGTSPCLHAILVASHVATNRAHHEQHLQEVSHSDLVSSSSSLSCSRLSSSSTLSAKH